MHEITEEQDKIKDCPNCYDIEVDVVQSMITGSFYVLCHTCHTCTGMYTTQEEAEAAWNDRR